MDKNYDFEADLTPLETTIRDFETDGKPITKFFRNIETYDIENDSDLKSCPNRSVLFLYQE